MLGNYEYIDNPLTDIVSIYLATLQILIKYLLEISNTLKIFRAITGKLDD